MIEINRRYEETRLMLIKKLNSPNSIEVIVTENIATRHGCYFCRKKIPEKDKLFKLVHHCLNSKRKIDEVIYFVDKNCMKLIKTKK